MEITDVPKALALKYAQFVDDRQFDRMREIMVQEFTQEGPGFHSGSLEEFIGSLHVLEVGRVALRTASPRGAIAASRPGHPPSASGLKIRKLWRSRKSPASFSSR